MQKYPYQVFNLYVPCNRKNVNRQKNATIEKKISTNLRASGGFDYCRNAVFCPKHFYLILNNFKINFML